MQESFDYSNIALTFRVICLVIIFIWAFYRAFVTDFIIRRVLFSLMTFNTILFLVLTIDQPANLFRTLFYMNLAFLAVYDFIQETKRERFFDAFRTIGGDEKEAY